MANMRTTRNVLTGVAVVAVCVGCVLLIYHFTVGAKVSSQAPADAASSLQAPEGVGAPPGSGAPHDSHARPATDEEAVTRPAGDKRLVPPGRSQGAPH
ncbi:MAG: hypothetical protein FJX74_16955 [Armatimonadetes bacterium]|nr:hypothetical protein [Armatimonadota bacterium]